MENEILELPKKENATTDDIIEMKDDITPSQYFDTIKNLKQTITDETIQMYIGNVEKLLKKAIVTKQTRMANDLIKKFNLLNRELNAVNNGFSIYILKIDLELFIKKVGKKVVKVIELKNYTRDIPDDIVDIVEKAYSCFDELYVCFTDYTGKEERKVEKDKRDKDPILFGAFADENGAVEPRLYYITEWIDDRCDLTLEEICYAIQDSENRGIIHKIDYSEDIELFKKQLDDMDKKGISAEVNKGMTLSEAESKGVKIKKYGIVNGVKTLLKEVGDKLKLPSSSSESEEVNEAESNKSWMPNEIEEIVPTKRRSRPKKNTTSESSSDITEPKKRRGRPKKNTGEEV